LWQIAEHPDVVSVLAAALEDKDPETRRAAADALGSIGPAGKSAVAALARVLRDKIPEVRKAAAQAMRKIDAEAAANVGVP
jgi:HEAT repeat protein